MDTRTLFAVDLQSTPIVTILPSLEALISCRLGDDAEPLRSFWEHLVRDILPNTPYVFNTRQEKGNLNPVSKNNLFDIQEAFKQACKGPDRNHPIDWATMAFHDKQDANELPMYSCSCSIGWISNPGEPRGLSLRITVPHDKIEKLAELGRELALGWPGVWRWISIGYRFVTVPLFSSSISEACRIINGRCRRFKGVDVGDMYGMLTSYWQNKIRTVNWITIISSALLHNIDEQQINESNKENAVEIERLSIGLLLRAGKNPGLCDVNRQESAKAFRLMDQMLRPIRANDPITFLPLLTGEETSEWLRRWETITQNQAAEVI